MTLTATDIHNWQRSLRYFFRSLSGIFRVPQYSIVAHCQCCWNRSSQNRFPAQWKLGLNPPICICVYIYIYIYTHIHIGGFNPNFHWAGKRFWLERFQQHWQCATMLYWGTRKIPERLRKKYLKLLCQLCISVAVSVILFAIVHTVYIPNFSGFGSVSAEILAEMWQDVCFWQVFF